MKSVQFESESVQFGMTILCFDFMARKAILSNTRTLEFCGASYWNGV